MKQMAVICDDLTGAMEAGLQLFNKGFKVYVTIDSSFMRQCEAGADAFIIDTESRNISIEEAEREVQAAWRGIAQEGFKLVYKKVDSTLRGNLGKEMEAILNESDFDMIVFAPSLPFNGRTTREGYHYLNGSKLIDSDLAKDPFSPITDSYIPNILKEQTSVHTEVISIEVVRRGEEFLKGVLEELYLKGCVIAIIDAETEDDLKTISEVFKKSRLQLLPCGSSGLFSKISLETESKVSATLNSNECKETIKDKAVFVISGSPAKATKNQIQMAGKKGLQILQLDTGIDNIHSLGEKEICEVIHKAVSHLKNGESVIIDGAGDGKEEIASQYHGNNQALLESSKKVQDIISQIFERVISETEIAGAMIIGGDTLNVICKKMKAKAIGITSEVEPYIPVGIMLRDKNKKIPIVSKAGGFGSEDIIIKAIRCLEGEV